MNNNFSYDKYSDSLIVSNKQENEIVKENFEAGDIIFSLTGKGKIVSIEIREFSSFLENCNINLEILNNIKNIQLNILPKKDTIFLILKIESLENNITLSKNIPLVVPFISQ
ncbi:MAG: DUF2283 domain-containing protein [Nanoarchaeota archaeon]|nr:DUF2283 domain-containing protein [Nanoarchaeota archaeon]